MNYEYTRKIINSPDCVSFPLHSHDGYELYFFIRGDCEYIVEGITYPLYPHDLIIINSGEMHRVQHRSSSVYERIVISLSPEFFKEMQCESYENLFSQKAIGRNSKINHRNAENIGLADAFMRLDRYSRDLGCEAAVIKCVIVEILHIIANMKISSDDACENKLVSSVIEYINDNLTNPLSLQKIASEFFISKYHLCRIFKAETGLTVINYINQKRITNVKKLCALGMNISRACLESGFSAYSTFYRAYVKEYHQKPKDEL